MTSDWLYIFLCSGTSVREVFDATRGTVGQVNISLTQCRKFDIPVPDVDEQREVARRVRAILALADRIATNVQDGDRMLDHVSRAAFARAFRGELVPTEASLAAEDGRDFEPAEELRARVLSPNAMSA